MTMRKTLSVITSIDPAYQYVPVLLEQSKRKTSAVGSGVPSVWLIGALAEDMITYGRSKYIVSHNENILQDNSLIKCIEMLSTIAMFFA